MSVMQAWDEIAAQAERDRKDAARYRWLIENDIHNELFSYGGDKDEIDAQIDKCMQVV